MPVDTQTPGSPGWWLKRLGDRLIARRPRYEALDLYFRGEQAVPALSGKATRQAFRDLMQMARMNYAELVIEAVQERMTPAGFRTGSEGDELEDREAWRMWQENYLDADSGLVHRASLSMGDAYVIVGADPDVPEGAPVRPLITPEDPREVITEEDPRRRRKTLAGLKMYRDASGDDVAYVYLPGRVYRFRADGSSPLSATVNGDREPVSVISAEGWSPDGVLELPAALRTEVPCVPFRNNPTLFNVGRGEFEPHLGLLDRISFTVLQRLEVATLQAFRQRAIKGVEARDEDGNKIDYSNIFDYSPGSLWLLPETAELWESQQVDLTPIRAAVKDDVQDLAAVTRTPLFYLTPEANNGSAEGASLAREGLVFKVTDRIKQAGQSWEQVMSLAFLLKGDTTRGNRADMEVIWASPERFSLAERYDAAVKAGSAGVPWRTVMTDILQFTPQQVDRMEAERAADSLLSGAAAEEEVPERARPPAPASPDDDAAGSMRERFDALGVAVRAGVDPADAAARVGLPGVRFTGAVPTSLRLPEEDAADLEET